MIVTLLVLLAIVLLTPFVLFGVFYKKMKPEVFVDSPKAYGFRKPHWSRAIVVGYGIVIGTIIDAFRVFAIRCYCRVRKLKLPDDVKGSIYQRASAEVFVTAPYNAGVIPNAFGAIEGKSLVNATKYLNDRAAVVQELVKQHGWRSTFIRYVMEIPRPSDTDPTKPAENAKGEVKCLFLLY